jgi:casein kinase 1
MKLNNGKGWEAMKAHPSAAHLNHGLPNSSQRELHGTRVSKTPIPHDRLNADLPKPGATRAAGPSRHPQQRRGESGYDSNTALAGQGKRQSTQDFRHPEGSTVAQFNPHSQQNLGPRTSMAQQPGLQSGNQQATQNRGTQDGEQLSGWQKFMKVICCG